MNIDKQAWKYFNPVSIEAGVGSLVSVANRLPPDGVALLVCSAGLLKRGLPESLAALVKTGRLLPFAEVTPNPELNFLDDVTQYLRSKSVSGIVAVGGGSVLDAAKVLSVTIPSDLDKPLSRVLRNQLQHKWLGTLPVVAIPTTAGTGSEVTPFATVWDSETKKKFSVFGEEVFPVCAILDPSLTVSLSRRDTLYTALDAISHALESIWNVNSNPISKAYALQALSLSSDNLLIVLDNPGDLFARNCLQVSSLMAGMAISQTKTAIAHSVSYPLTSHYQVPHGLACSFTLPALIDAHLQNEQDQQVISIFLKVQKVLQAVGLSEEIKKYVCISDVMQLVDQMYDPSRAKNYVHSLEIGGLEKILKASMVK